MKFSHCLFTFISIFVFSISYFSQSKPEKKPEKISEKSKKEKSYKKSDEPIEVKANIMVLDPQNYPIDDVKQEDLKIFEDGVEQKITYFAKKENDLNIGLVMDNTGSMRTQFGEIIRAGATLVGVLRPRDEMFLMRFVSSDNIEIVEPWTSDKARLNKGLAYMFVAGGASAVIDAIYLSADKLLEREKANKQKRCALILITDGEDRQSFYKKEDIFKLFKGSDAQVFTIGLIGELQEKDVRQSSVRFLNQLALETGGASYFVESSKGKNFEAALISALKAILAELGSQYVVGYTSTNVKRDDLTRKLRVEIANGGKGEKRQCFIRAEFIVPKEK